MGKFDKKKLSIVLTLECVLLLVVAACGYAMNRNRSEIPVNYAAMTSNGAYELVDGNWKVTGDRLDEDGLLNGADEEDANQYHLLSEKVTLPKGDYTLIIQYDVSATQEVSFRADEEYTYFLEAETYKLFKNLPSSMYHLHAKEDVKDFQISVDYNNYGEATIYSIQLVPNADGLKRMLMGMLLVFALLDFLMLKWQWIRSHRTRLIILTLVGIASSLPIFAYGISGGHDLEIHLVRIEAIAHELMLHQFPVRIASLWLEGFGYPGSIYYGETLLYFPAILRIFGFSVMTSYKIFVLAVNMVTVFLSYACFRGIFKDYKVAVVTAVAYSIAPYRLVDLYARHAVGEYTAMIFFLVIALAMYRIYTEDVKSWKRYNRNSLLLAIGMVGLLVTHTLSVEMGVFVLAIVAIAFAKRTFRKETLLVLLHAAGLTALLGAFFIVPFLDYYFTVPAQINAQMDGGAFAAIQWGGAYISEYFNVFEELFGWNSVVLNERMALTPGLMLMIGLLLALGFWFKGDATKQMKISSAFSVLLLWMASNLFPWDFITLHVWSGASVIQFPWRFIGIADTFLALTLGFTMLRIKDLPRGKEVFDVDPEEWTQAKERVGARRHRDSYIWLLACGALSLLVFAQQYSSYDFVVNYHDTDELNVNFVTSFFLRTDTPEAAVPKGVAKNRNIEQFDYLTREGTYNVFYVKAGDKGGTVELPLINYKGYHVTDDNGTEYEIHDGTIDLISVDLPAGFDGNLTTRFIEPWYWRVAEFISLVTLGYAIWMMHWKKKYEL
ncbi:MAG: hypothetical protein E7278_11835 [Lachnospiraceae bacterium]|nr:hypothetical protein [Lachnospiraceae bacterium]